MESTEHVESARRASTDALVGRLLDRRYRIGPRIARGGMASVYEAEDIRLDRTVAVKVMHPGLGDDDDFAQRFVREARAAAKLNHPHVVGVYDQGDDDGVVFLAMEYVPGHTLRDVIRKEAPMTPARALSLLEPIVSALAAAHRAGLVHRDVKPENVLIADEAHGGGVKVADFGLAKAISADTQHTATGGVLIGTVSYLAPELVVDGRSDARADVYAAGVVLYELLTGNKPHEGESPIQVAYRHVHEDVPPPSRVVPEIPAYVDALVARATARDRSQRPADAAVLLHQIHRVAQALHAGVHDDPDLTADLALSPARHDPFEDVEVEDVLVEERNDTTALEHLPAVFAPTRVRPVASPPRRPAARRPAAPLPVHTTPRRRSVKGPLSFLLVVLLLIGVGAGAWWFGFARYTTTPGVLGVTEAAAASQLEREGLDTEVGTPRFSETVEAGLVLATEPEPGERVLRDGTVSLVVSLGPERYDVPDVKSMTEDEAQDALQQSNLSFGDSTEKFSESIPLGAVIKTVPAVGTTVKPDTSVDLVVSKGRLPIEISDWTGKDADQAVAALEKRKLVVEVAGEEYSDSVAEGDVISQDPAAGPLFKGDTVALVVSKGPELVEVPRVIAMGVEAATEKLEALGFQVDVQNSESYIGVGFVFSTSPGAGDMVARGSTITLYLI
ncbi:Stk1 family PASTA domain-containing Ser/Thr kinase [Nocardioides sp.]|uniref:Stk1 family PASTA domain-containing Ser/Thr kinase n=1 Tax=Nocardioides sp. TaxID=35761 RepID=UPI002B5BF27A|nr:Stk1 family PASTA domain-containing Ser/Thr kinase [Nocardioides sp.]HXH78022.1 Stk1 family PASTA domain-containing Ser/Thr kinase [Nocardioides sp.]